MIITLSFAEAAASQVIWAAEQTGQSSASPSPWWAVPAGVILAAVVAGFVNWRTAKKDPHDKLEQLVGIAKDWPDDLPGKAMVYQAIELTLGQVRRADGLEDLPDTSEREPTDASSERSAYRESIDRIVREQVIEDDRQDFLAWLRVVLVMPLLVVPLFLKTAEQTTTFDQVVIGASTAVLAYALGRTLLHGFHWWKLRREAKALDAPQPTGDQRG